MIIYKITNKIDGKMYIGQTVQVLKDRWRDHVRGDKTRPDSYLYRAIAKHGVENFTVEEIDASKTLEGLNVLEQHYILTLNTLAPNGYNLHLGGDNKRCHEDTKIKISETLKGRPIKNRWDKGRSQPHTEETKDLISSKLKGRPIKNRWDKGNKSVRTQETRDKISQTMTGVPQPHKHKPVLVVETGAVYMSVATAAQATGIPRTTVSTLLTSGKTHKKKGITFRAA